MTGKDKGVDEARRELASRFARRKATAEPVGEAAVNQHLSPRATPPQGPATRGLFMGPPEQKPPRSPPPCQVSRVAHADGR
jgi:hypothetical protein